MGCFSIPIPRETKVRERPSSSSSSSTSPSPSPSPSTTLTIATLSSPSSSSRKKEDVVDIARFGSTFAPSPRKLTSARSANISRHNVDVIDVGCSAPTFRSISLYSPKSILIPSSPSADRSSSICKQKPHQQQRIKNAWFEQHSSSNHAQHCGSHNEDEGRQIFHSAPLSSIPRIEMCSHERIGRRPEHLFPLPLPPSSDDVSLSSTISSSSSSSSSSIPSSSSICSSSSSSHMRRDYNNPLNHSNESTNSTITSNFVPLPLPPLLPRLREFSFDELAGACLNFAAEFYVRNGGVGPVYRATFRRSVDQLKQQQEADGDGEREGEEGAPPMEVSITVLSKPHPLTRFKKWQADLESLARLNHPNLCKLIGFTREDASTTSTLCDGIGVHGQRERLLVFDYAAKGSLDTLLYGRKGRAPLDWATRLKIAVGAAEGLAFLHDRTPRQIIYKLFKPLNIQVDHNFNAKLSDYYGFATPSHVAVSSSLTSASSLLEGMDDAYAAPETRASGEVTAKTNVWSFGVVLLELLTGRQNMDEMFPDEERNLVQWCRPYLLDPKRLYLVMDPELKGRYPTRAAKTVADLALLCLAEDPKARPSMRNVVGALSPQQVTPMNYNVSSLLRHQNSANMSRTLSYKAKAKLSKSYSLASVLTSPGRIFPDAKALDFIQGHHLRPTTQGLPNNHHYPIYQGKPRFLSGEMVKRRASRPPSFCSVSGEILVNP